MRGHGVAGGGAGGGGVKGGKGGGNFLSLGLKLKNSTKFFII